MNKNTAAAVTTVAVLFASPWVRKYTGKVLRKVAAFLDPDTTPRRPEPMWIDEDPEEEPEEVLPDPFPKPKRPKKSRLTLKEYRNDD